MVSVSIRRRQVAYAPSGAFHVGAHASERRSLVVALPIEAGGQGRADNGTEFASRAMDRWAYGCGVEMDFGWPGKPTDSAFNGTFRRQCLSQHWFVSPGDVRETLSLWKDD
jgi:transposase InsO family protein